MYPILYPELFAITSNKSKIWTVYVPYLSNPLSEYNPSYAKKNKDGDSQYKTMNPIK